MRRGANLSGFDRCQKGVLRFDLYKQPFRLLLPDEKDNYRTFAGSILTICSIIAIIVYASLKLNMMFNFDDYKVQERNFKQLYLDTDRFTHKDGFMVAAGLVSVN